MDEALVSPSVYNTANESLASTPRPFFTPISSRPSTAGSDHCDLADATVDPPLADRSILQQYVDTYTPPSPREPALRDTGMPVTTRFQERGRMAEAASPATPPNLGARADSPIVREDVLRGCSPHSPSYDKLLEESVDRLCQGLMRRGRTQEGHGVRELYIQSFKDPGSKHLLDSLLRARATDRQLIDFKRYVDDVNKLREPPPVVVIPMRPSPATVLGKRMRETVEGTFERASVPQTEPDSRRGPEQLPGGDEREFFESSKEVELENSSTAERLQATDDSTFPIEQNEDDYPMAEKDQREDDASFGISAQASAAAQYDQGPATRGPESVAMEDNNDCGNDGQSITLMRASHPRPKYVRAKRKRNRMFSGANGPVYSRTIWNRDS